MKDAGNGMKGQGLMCLCAAILLVFSSCAAHDAEEKSMAEENSTSSAEQLEGSAMEIINEAMTIYYADERGVIRDSSIEKPVWEPTTKGRVIFDMWKQHNDVPDEIDLIDFEILYNDGFYHNEEGGKVWVATYTYDVTLSKESKVLLDQLESSGALMQSLVLTFAYTDGNPDKVLVNIMADGQSICKNGITSQR